MIDSKQKFLEFHINGCIRYIRHKAANRKAFEPDHFANMIGWLDMGYLESNQKQENSADSFSSSIDSDSEENERKKIKKLVYRLEDEKESVHMKIRGLSH